VPRATAGHPQRGRGHRTHAGQHHHRLAGQIVDQILDDVEGLGVHIVQITQADQGATLAPDHAEQAQHAFGEHHRRIVIVQDLPVAPLGDQPRQRRAVGHKVGVVGDAPEAGLGEQGFGQRAVGDGCRRGRGAAAKHHHAGRLREGGAFPHQTRLA
jgi:hypothetical protein